MSKLKLISLSMAASIILSIAQIFLKIYFSINSLWQVDLMGYFVPHPILGYTAQGQPLYEGTPVDILAGFVGLLFGCAIYSIVVYLMVKRIWVQK